MRSGLRQIIAGCLLLAFAAVAPVNAFTQEESPPPDEAAPAEAPKRQVIVSVKIIEFQITKGVDTGFSAFLAKVPEDEPFGEVSLSGNAINFADLTFPTPTAAGITVFLDRISISQGDIELVLQALVDENRAFILSEPRTMVVVGERPSIVGTTTSIPYENTIVVGSTTVQVTTFEDTGVELAVGVPNVIDDDGSPITLDDTYIHLDVNAAVREEGQRIVVALDDQLAAGGDFSLARNAIQVPEFISRSIDTEVWVRHGQVLILGGLYRNSETKQLSTLPWLRQAEDLAVGAAENIVPGNFLASPVSSTLGSRSTAESRRELVFMIKAEVWQPFDTLPVEFGLREAPEESRIPNPVDIITDVSEGITNIFQPREDNNRTRDIPEDDPPEEDEEP